LHCCGTGHLGLFDARTCGHGVGAHLYGFLGLLRRLSRVLALYQGLVNDTGGLARCEGSAAFERPRAGATGQQEGQREPGAKKGGEVVHGGRLPLARAPNLEP